MTIITAKQASAILDVSQATVRNWVRHGYLIPVEGTKNKFRDTDVDNLKKRIRYREIERLTKRANKRDSGNSFIPEEYLNDAAFVSEAKAISNIFISDRLDMEITLFVLALKQLVLLGEVRQNNLSDTLKIETYSDWNRSCVRNVICSWSKDLNLENELSKAGYIRIYDALTCTAHDDTLGILYQSLLKEGNKSKQGAYYTPQKIVDAIFREYCDLGGKFLDPCCGTGQFLMGAVRSGFRNPDMLYGYDMDGLAVKIARINLLLAYRKIEFSPKIYRADTLKDVANDLLFCETNNLQSSFRFIATNPPWGSALSREKTNDYNQMFSHITSGESFSYFLSKSISLAEENGCLSFILPESVLNIKIHADIREYILRNTTIRSIRRLGRIFKGVFSPVIRLDLIKKKRPEGWAVDIRLETRKDGGSNMLKNCRDGSPTRLYGGLSTNLTQHPQKIYPIPQARFEQNENFIFDVNLSEEESRILSLLYDMPHVTLKDGAEWAIGIVTGDNKKYVFDQKRHGTEPIFKGSDVAPYRLSKPSSYIEFKPEKFQQVAPAYKYRTPEKLIYRFISEKLVFAYDNAGYLTLNSANILIPKLENYPVRLILGFLNSRLYNFIYAKKFDTHKILRGDLESLPFPIIKKEDQDSIISLVDAAIEGKDVRDMLDFTIMRIIGLSQRQIEMIIK